MHRLLSFLMAVDVVGVAVQVSPTVRELWKSLPASKLVARVAGQLPGAAAWPIRAYGSGQRIAGPVPLRFERAGPRRLSDSVRHVAPV